MKLVLILLLISPSSWASELEAIEKNNEGVQLLKEELPSVAYRKFLEGLAESPFSPELRLNLGITFESSKEFQKAFNEYLAASKRTEDRGFQFFALFNAAAVLAKQKKVPEALQYYQAALEINPVSKETKTNIELLIQQQSGGGGGKSDKDQKKDKNKGDNKDDKNKNDDKPDENSKVVNRRDQKPKEFESKELTRKDVEKILEELKNQEQKVRAKQNKKAAKEKPREKDW